VERAAQRRLRRTEGTPADVALAEILHTAALLDEQLDLRLHAEGTVLGEVIACQFVLDALHHRQRTFIERLGDGCLVSVALVAASKARQLVRTLALLGERRAS